MDYKELDRKWQKQWDDAKIFESDPNTKEPYFVTAAFPYPNGPQHIGHIRTYGTADVLARYKRMQGFNVLFPMGFHATGTPILAFAKRIKNKDPDLIADLKMFHIPDLDIDKMTDPLFIANYFINEIEGGMHRAGYSIDWRRKFISIEPFFSKFIEWQFGILNSKGYLVKGKHPVGWCPNENNAVGMHDTRKDVEPEIAKELAIKFKIDGEDSYIVCSTYRAETVSGVTNLFVKDSAAYISCQIDGKGTYYISKASSEALKFQFNIEQTGEISGADLLKKTCINPATGAKISVLPGFFVEENIGTGAVMSVPAHAPFDYAALEKLRAEGKAPEIKPIKVLEIPIDQTDQSLNMQQYVDRPALAYIEMFKKSMTDEDQVLESATKQQYKEESHKGRMIVKGYEGMSEPAAREKIEKDLEAKGDAFSIYILANAPVYCRCGFQVVVKVVDNQWFLNYGDAAWKAETKKAFNSVAILPEKSRRAFEAAIDWIDLRAVARSQGLGTKFPLDTNYIIESLSDSTIYMAFYTISYLIRSIPVESLKPEFFNYVFLNTGDPDSVSKSTGIDYQIVKRCRESFDYWYRNTSRGSGPDLIFNHLTMYIFNHVAIFPEERWPKQIVVNGSVLSEGQKMSKSLGNIVPLSDALAKYGADILRTIVIAGADLPSDSEFSEEAAKGLDERFVYIHDVVEKSQEMEGGELRHIDYWLYSKLNRKIRSVTAQIEKLELRGVSTSVIYDSVLELKKYYARGKPNGMVLKDYISRIVLMIAPIAPHIAEEMWHMLGNDTFVSTERWPIFDESMISDKIEQEEDFLEGTIADSKQVIALMKKSGKDAKSIKLIVADEWKRNVGNAVIEGRNISPVMAKLNTDEGLDSLGVPRERKDAAMKYVQNLAKKMNSLKKVEPSQDEELKLLSDATDYISAALNCSVGVEKESDSKSQRAANAMPQRPSIDISS